MMSTRYFDQVFAIEVRLTAVVLTVEMECGECQDPVAEESVGRRESWDRCLPKMTIAMTISKSEAG